MRDKIFVSMNFIIKLGLIYVYIHFNANDDTLKSRLFPSDVTFSHQKFSLQFP